MIKEILYKLRSINILKDSFWLLYGSFFLKGSSFIITILIARFIAVPDMGVFSFVKASATTFTSIIIYFLGLASTKIIAETVASKKENKGVILGSLRLCEYVIIGFLLVVYLVFKGFVDEVIFNNQLNNITIILVFLILLFSTDSGINQAMLIGFNQIKKLGKINVITSILILPISIALVLIYKNYYGAIVGLVLAYFVESVLKRILIYKHLKSQDDAISYVFEKEIFKKIFNISIATLCMALVTNLTFYYVKVLMVKQEGGVKELAYFEIAYQWFMIIGIISSTITSPVVAKVNYYTNNQSLLKFVKQLTAILLLITITYNIIVFFLKDQISLLYGEEYILIAPMIQIFALASIFSTLFYLLDKILIGRDYVWLCLIGYLIYSASFLICSYMGLINSKNIAVAFLYSWIIGLVTMAIFFILLLHKQTKNKVFVHREK